MDADGWIPVELLASFRRVRIHTGAVNTQLIVDVSGSRFSLWFHASVTIAWDWDRVISGVCDCLSVCVCDPLSSDRQHLSCDVCLEVRGEIIRTVLCGIVY